MDESWKQGRKLEGKNGDTLSVQIQILSADIKACEKSKAEFQRHLT